MALDATVLGVERDGSDVVLTLGPRIQDDDRLTLAGQSKLRIVAATWEPPIGADLWGGAFFVEIVLQSERFGKTVRHYRREGYSRLYEIDTFQREATK